VGREREEAERVCKRGREREGEGGGEGEGKEEDRGRKGGREREKGHLAGNETGAGDLDEGADAELDAVARLLEDGLGLRHEQLLPHCSTTRHIPNPAVCCLLLAACCLLLAARVLLLAAYPTAPLLITYQTRRLNLV